MTGLQCWTEWFDRDDPSGKGDFEELYALRNEYPGKICNSPLQIEVQTVSGLTVDETGNVIAVADTPIGFICKSSDQADCMCHDYRVRFMRPVDFCSQEGTFFLFLTHCILKENPGEICESPLHIYARTADTNIPATSTGQSIFIPHALDGFTCRNRDQKGSRCRDYKVRFGCPYRGYN
uniref:WxxW domain-containing protein n=1 Tax=Seriola lalandi dorsalis TaxID=1841481 RepID=A0A3B4Y149_SERLL